jgi:dihydrofolate synthase/folylpolyglutamate synthase
MTPPKLVMDSPLIERRASKIEDAFSYVQSLDHVDTPRHTREYHFHHGIARARHLLDWLGGAPSTARSCVLVAGSKGKGSTAAMLSSILAAAGHRVGAFTGPHLHSPLERFAILGAGISGLGDGRWRCVPVPMTPPTFVTLSERVRQAVEAWDRPDLGIPTRFEAFTAMAFRWFEEQAVDIAVMEIGIGGRRDAVNLANPILSVITNISLEHTEILGDTLPQIAREKAGIMRPGRPVVSSEQEPEVRQALRDEADTIGARLAFADDDCQVEQVGIQLAPAGRAGGQWIRFHRNHCAADAADDQSRSDVSAPMLLSLHGNYQLQNVVTASLAASELTALGYAIDANAIRDGLRYVRWPGRFEVLGWDPMVIADGAHTPHSMRQLCESLDRYFHLRPIHFIVGILRDKDARGMLEAISLAASSVRLCDMPVRRATPADHLLELWNALSSPRVKPATAAGLAEAVSAARAQARSGDVICITGSLHLVAEAEELLNTDPGG